MTEKELQAFKGKIKRRTKVMKRLKATAPGETICLNYDEVASVLEYIDALWKADIERT